MKIYFADFFCERCASAGYKTPNDYFKVNLDIMTAVILQPVHHY